MIREELEKLVSNYTANIHSRTIEELAQKEQGLVEAILSKIGTSTIEEKDSPLKYNPEMKTVILDPIDGQVHMQAPGEVFIFKAVMGKWEWLDNIEERTPTRKENIEIFIDECISSGKCVMNLLNLTWQETHEIERSVNNHSDKKARRVLNKVLTRVKYE
jgi:hypothetical protein